MVAEEMDDDDLSAENLDGRLLSLWRDSDNAGRERIRKLLTGVLAERVTLTRDEVRYLTPMDAEVLADALPDDALGDWIGRGRTN
jgi:hypothetical protein